jgi:hypothetical protein
MPNSVGEFIHGAGELDDMGGVINRKVRQKIRAALEDPCTDVPAEEVFARLRADHESQLKADPDNA